MIKIIERILDWFDGFKYEKDMPPWFCINCKRKIKPFYKNIGYHKCSKCRRDEK